MQINKQHIFILLIITMMIVSSCSISKRTPSRYHTLTERAQVTLTLDQHQYHMSSQVRIWRNELAVVAVQPMLGIEMVRMEATPDSVWIFDKMNRKYVALSYSDIQQTLNTHISYKTIQNFLTHQTTKSKEPIQLQLTSGKHQLKLSCTFSNREHNTLQSPTRTKTNKYKRVTLREILPI